MHAEAARFEHSKHDHPDRLGARQSNGFREIPIFISSRTTDGKIETIFPPQTTFLIFDHLAVIQIGRSGTHHLVSTGFWRIRSSIIAPDFFPADIYHKGDDVIKMRSSAGDHLFVDRLTYNFRKPERGEIIVFETAGHSEEMREPIQSRRSILHQAAGRSMPGEQVSIGDDRHLVINGQRLDASTPHFENVYGFNPNDPPRESQYSGHVNGTVAQKFNLYPNLAPLFPDAQTVFNN